MAAKTVVLASRNAAKVRELARILGVPDPATGQISPAAGQADVGPIRLVGLDEFPGAPDVPETGATFEENALLKARSIAEYTGLPAVADDSGLCVYALNGMPGVLSARWAGRHGDDRANLELVLAQVSDVPAPRRGARFVCAAALVTPPDSTSTPRDPAAPAPHTPREPRVSRDPAPHTPREPRVSRDPAHRDPHAPYAFREPRTPHTPLAPHSPLAPHTPREPHAPLEWVVTGELEGRLIKVPRGSGGFGYDPIFLPDGFDQTTAEMTAEAKDAISHRGRAFRALAPFITRLA
jgi:XTP/dITP diphosphohydrolase